MMIFIDSSTSYPVLTAAVNAALECQLNQGLSFVASVVEKYTDYQVESSTVLAILKGESLPPFESPLDCISEELIAIRDQVGEITSSLAEPPALVSGKLFYFF